jgi:hypothetical protein
MILVMKDRDGAWSNIITRRAITGMHAAQCSFLPGFHSG